MTSNLKTAEKCYDPLDSTLKFVDKEDEMDSSSSTCCEKVTIPLYDIVFPVDLEGFKSRKALMSCGHAVTPTSLTNWCRRLLNQGESSFVCGSCTVEWPYKEVRKMALLTPEEMECFEKRMASNTATSYFDTRMCPKCKSSLLRKNQSDLRVRCTVCTANDGEPYDFCWQCLNKWKGRAPRLDRCDNDGCVNEALKALRDCPEITFQSVTGVTGCPSLRACPTCGGMVEHDKTKCKNIKCPRCKVEFCFVCLKLTKECLKTTSRGYFKACEAGVAPRQASLPVWKKQ